MRRRLGGSLESSRWSFLNSPAHASQVIAEAEGMHLFAAGKVGVELHLATQRHASSYEFGLTPFDVADGLRKREDIPSVCDWHEQHAIIVAED